MSAKRNKVLVRRVIEGVLKWGAPGLAGERFSPGYVDNNPSTPGMGGLETVKRSVADWLPTPDDREQVAALMTPHYEEGEFASWIAPPSVGINDMPVEYDYVRF